MEMDPFPQRILDFAATRTGKKFTKRCLNKLTAAYPNMIFSQTTSGWNIGIRWYKDLRATSLNTEPTYQNYSDSRKMTIAREDGYWMTVEEIKTKNEWCFDAKESRNAYRQRILNPNSPEHESLVRCVNTMDAFILVYQEFKEHLEELDSSYIILNYLRSKTESAINIF
jgi:hypothetical protein